MRLTTDTLIAVAAAFILGGAVGALTASMASGRRKVST
jgi:hypothetical protein